MSYASEAITHGVRVQTRTFYVPERSDPEAPQFLFAYRIRITNEGDSAARLLSRHWIITDALGHVEEVRGPGVVGEHPHLEPGESFEYTSACPLPTEFGVMRGSYRFERDDGSSFDVEVAPFKLYIHAHAN